jgi:hypothetical protein
VKLKTAALLVVVLTLMVYLMNREAPAQSTSGAPAQSAPDNEVSWATLRGLDRGTGRPSDEVKALDGKKIRIAGYVVPLDDDATQMSEFLLAPWAGACIHTPPPPPNQLIYVKMARGEQAYAALMDAVWVEGTIFIGRRGSPYGPTFYAMTASAVRPYR